MNAKHPTTSRAPLREQIARHLDAEPESPVKAIAQACGQAEYPSRIVGALNIMRTDGDVECEQRKGEMRYWLARPLDVILSGEQGAITAAPRRAETTPAPTRQMERAEQRREIIRTAIAGKTAANGPTLKYLAEACECTVPAVDQLVAPMISAGTVGKARADGERFNRLFDPKAIVPPQPEVGENTGGDGSAVQAQDDSTEAAAVQQPAPAPAPTPSPEPVAEDDRIPQSEMYLLNVIADIRAAIGDTGQLMLDELAPKIQQVRRDAEELYSARKVMSQHDALVSRATKAEAERDLAHANLDEVHEILSPFAGELDPSDMDEIQLAKMAAATIRNLLGTVEAMAKDGAVDVLDAARAYVIRAPKRRPRIIVKPERAREAALSAVRGGAPRAEVFALVSVGVARRGAEWTDGQ